MTNYQNSVTRRHTLKLAGLVAASGATTIGETNPSDADDIVLQSADIRWSDDEIDIRAEDADFFRRLSQMVPETADADVGSVAYIGHERGKVVTGTASVAAVFPGSAPQESTVRDAMDASFEGFPAQVAGTSDRIVATQADSDGIEWKLTVPNPEWTLDAPYSDVTWLQVTEDAILLSVVYGPATNNPRPETLARRYGARMRRRAQKGGNRHE